MLFGVSGHLLLLLLTNDDGLRCYARHAYILLALQDWAQRWRRGHSRSSRPLPPHGPSSSCPRLPAPARPPLCLTLRGGAPGLQPAAGWESKEGLLLVATRGRGWGWVDRAAPGGRVVCHMAWQGQRCGLWPRQGIGRYSTTGRQAASTR